MILILNMITLFCEPDNIIYKIIFDLLELIENNI